MPGRPTNLSINAPPSEFELRVTWAPAPRASSYKLSWRKADRDFEPDNAAAVSATTATITVPEYGRWVVQVEGCNQAGCGQSVSADHLVMLPVCDRTPQVRDKLVQLVGKPRCDLVSAHDLARLDAFYLSDAGVSALKTGDFHGLHNIDVLEMYRNNLTELPEDVFDGLSSLSVLLLYDNNLTALPEEVFDGLSSLDVLALFRNNLTELPEDVFDGLSSLHRLELCSNDLGELPEDIFDGLTNLKRLNLCDTGLTELPEDVFDGLPSLFALLLHHNGLGELPEDIFDGLPSLGTVYLHHNKLTELPEDVFDGLPSLGTVYLHHNKLTELPEDVFDGLPRLGTVYLHHNKLTELPEGVFDCLPELSKLWLSHNPGAPFDLNLPEVEVRGVKNRNVDNLIGLSCLERVTVDGDRLTLPFDAVLDEASVPASSAFTVKLTGSEVSLANANPVAIAEKAVTLTLAAAVSAGDTVTVSYAIPSTNPLRNVVGEVRHFADVSATNLTGVPRVTSVTVTSTPASGDTYGLGDEIRLTVTFNEMVEVDTSGAPRG